MTRSSNGRLWLIAVALSAALLMSTSQLALAGGCDGALCSLARMNDAQRLRQQADLLFNQATLLKEKTEDLIAETLSGEVSSQRDQGLRYQQLLNQYHDALNAYLQHRLQLQQHVNDFHQSNDLEKTLETPVSLVPFKALKQAASMQCLYMQVAEKNLATLEEQLNVVINYLISKRTPTPTPDYTLKLNMAMGLIDQHRQFMTEFDNDLMGKHNAARDQMNSQVHLAVDEGDYVQSQQVFQQVQTRNNIVQQEAERGQQHAMLGKLFHDKLEILAHPQEAAQQSANAGTMDMIPDADVQLEKEYALVQQLYKDVQAAHPPTSPK